MTLDPKALEALKNNQRQLDMDGCEVGVSRQALDELIAAWEARKESAPQFLVTEDGEFNGNVEPIDDRVPIAATDGRKVDWVDVTGWGAFKGQEGE
ncbi:hypothetical protein C7441_112121 [Pseudaminobacter salicylatoxidans]|uniref:Uncharacterized protein n=1 Tax=Pseudaminobacter salicylatoxidans TaxID=93369 RepID=A0A316CLD4_PSESE|nr:hypothetical protein [Pseudaminobacter salicylatoxidans]PWJ80579.1 hypothetical protein C7441_112121 [Pseudaminobacter salicylatoxidans]